jgi:hypothetical protein
MADGPGYYGGGWMVGWLDRRQASNHFQRGTMVLGDEAQGSLWEFVGTWGNSLELA